MPTLTINTDSLKKIEQYYAPYKKDKTPPYSLFSAVKNGVTITAYASGKVLFQGCLADEEAALWQTTSHKQVKMNQLPTNFSQLSVIGSDETGTGSYFGSVVVCAAFVNKKQLLLLKNLGVQDSKNLSDKRISELADILKRTIPYELLVVEPKKYNDIQPTMSQGKMKAILHNYALSKLLKKIAPTRPDAILIDQFELPKTYFNHIKDESLIIKDNVFFATKGESHHLAVAAASIIARASFVENLAYLSTIAKTSLPSGAGPQVDKIAASLITKKGADNLYHYAKLHFANTEKAKKLV